MQNYQVSGWVETQISVQIQAASAEEAEAKFYQICAETVSTLQAERNIADQIGQDAIEYVDGNGPFLSDVTELDDEEVSNG